MKTKFVMAATVLAVGVTVVIVALGALGHSNWAAVARALPASARAFVPASARSARMLAARNQAEVRSATGASSPRPGTAPISDRGTRANAGGPRPRGLHRDPPVPGLLGHPRASQIAVP